jgi:apolipoprotein N-acyltransferase
MRMLEKRAHDIILAWGWRRYVIALVAGAVSALALPPLGLFPLLWVTLPIAVYLIDGSAGLSLLSAARSAAYAGWCFGFGFFLCGLWWIGQAFLFRQEEFLFFLPFAVLGLPALLAFFPAFGFAVARIFWPRGGLRIGVFAGMLALSEWLRGHMLTGFPWNCFGMALGQYLPLAQTASWCGLYGLTFLTLWIFASPATLFSPDKTVWQRCFFPVLTSGLFIGLFMWGSERLNSANQLGFVPGVQLRLVQPNIPPNDSFWSGNAETMVHRYLTLSDQAASPAVSGLADVTHVFWPESAFPFDLSRSENAMALISETLPEKTTLITGAVSSESGHPFDPVLENVMLVIGREKGEKAKPVHILDTYAKVHLVPFGEYVPFSDILESIGLRPLVRQIGAFKPGMPRMMHVPGIGGVASLICYEALFPDKAVPKGKRPKVLINITYDGWFGLTFGPYQHFSQARLRAIEEGLPLVRVAHTGISAVIDSYGRIVRYLPLGVTGVIDSGLPKAQPPTVYAKQGDMVFFIMVVLSFLLDLIFGQIFLFFSKTKQILTH